MTNPNQKKLKKYLFLISIVFFFIISSHLFYEFLYEGSETKPKKGGTISEGLIGNFPTLNPLTPLSGDNKYVLSFLYKSLLKYDIEQKKIVGDIASCDISSLINIDCVINDDALWSNGDKIKTDDIVSTYNLIKETKSNPSIAANLEDVEIEASGDRIIFKNKKKDVNFLNIFFQPIISQKTIDTLTKQNIEGSFPYKGGIYSGDYVFEGVKTDDDLGISKLIISRNKNSKKANASKIVFSIFPDENNLKVNKQVIDVFNDENNILGDSVPRFNSNRYNLPQFLSIFVNSKKIENKNLRTIILNEIQRENLVKLLGNINYEPVYNPFFSEVKIKTQPKNNNLEEVMSSLGYKKKSRLLEDFRKQKKKTTKKEETPTPKKEETKVVENTKTEKLDRSKGIERYQKDSVIIKKPTYVDIYNFITKDDFKLIGKVESGVEAVYINDYKLQGFSAGDSEFYYRIKEGGVFNSIKEGENTYKIFFEKDGKKELKETIFFLFYKDKSTLEAKTKAFINSLYENEEKEIEKKSQKKTEEKAIVKDTEEEKPEIDSEQIDTKRLKELEALDDKLYYDKKLKPFTLKLIYLNSRKDFDDTATFIRESLKEIGITIEAQGLPKKEFSSALQDKQYDLLLGGIDLGYFKLNLYPYFHSSQAESGFNYPAIRRTSLDIIMEQAKETIYSEEKEKQLEKEILNIFKEEQVLKTLYSPKTNLLVGKNIKFSKKIDFLPSTELRNEIIKQSYIKQEQVLSLKGKSLGGFISYIFKKLYE